jgi:hypothetical protein
LEPGGSAPFHLLDGSPLFTFTDSDVGHQPKLKGEENEDGKSIDEFSVKPTV